MVLVVRGGKEDVFRGTSCINKIVSTPDLFKENELWWEKQCEGVDVVIHSAWYAEPGKYLPSPINMACLTGSLNLALGAVNAGIKRFIGIGTCFEYDLSPGTLSVETPLKPLTPYAAAKASLYYALLHWLPAVSVAFAWCRLFYLYGEGEHRNRLVPYLRERLEKGVPADLTSGNQIRDFLDVADAGRLITEVALGSQQGPINICSGEAITVRQIAEQIADEYGRRDLLKFGTRPDNLIDPLRVVGVSNHGVTQQQ